MATLVDLSLVGFFGNLFLFLFVFALMYGILSVSKVFSGSGWEKGLYSIISLVTALIVSLTRQTFTLVSTFVPWFAVVVILLFLSFMLVRMFGVGDDFIAGLMKKQVFGWLIAAVVIIITLSSLSTTFGQQLLDEGTGVEGTDSGNNVPSTTVDVDGTSGSSRPSSGSSGAVNSRDELLEDARQPGATSSDDFSGNVLATIVHPKVLGMLLLLLISFFTILLVARTTDPNNE